MTIVNRLMKRYMMFIHSKRLWHLSSVDVYTVEEVINNHELSKKSLSSTRDKLIYKQVLEKIFTAELRSTKMSTAYHFQTIRVKDESDSENILVSLCQ